MTARHKRQSVLVSQPATLMHVPVSADLQIWLCLLVPTVVHFILYVLDLAFCLSVIHCHYKEGNLLWAGLTLLVLYVPSVVFFTSLVSKPDVWSEHIEQGRAPYWFTIRLINLFFFPAWGIYRYAKQFFWSVEALTHNDEEREQALAMATKSSHTELLLFLHAFLNCAPQALLQLVILFVEFEDHMETDSMQVLCIASSLMILAATITSFQRFESHKVLGRQKPWSQQQKAIHNTQPLKTPDTEQQMMKESTGNEMEGTPYLQPKAQSSCMVNAQSDWEIMGLDFDYIDLPPRRLSLPQSPPPEVPSGIKEFSKSEASVRKLSPPPKTTHNFLVLSPPNCPPPPPPPPLLRTPDSLENIAVPNNPPSLQQKQEAGTRLLALPKYPSSPKEPVKQDHQEPTETEIPLPIRKTKRKGLEQDDIVGKSVLFLGWWFFLVSRVLSMVSFSHFFPSAAAAVFCVHYLVTVGYMAMYTSYTGLNRVLIPIYLGYVFLFCILEFRTQFKKALLTYIVYVCIIIAENVILSSVWYFSVEWEGWWYKYTYTLIFGSLLISLSAMATYFVLLKPKSQIFYDDS